MINTKSFLRNRRMQRPKRRPRPDITSSEHGGYPLKLPLHLQLFVFSTIGWHSQISGTDNGAAICNW